METIVFLSILTVVISWPANEPAHTKACLSITMAVRNNSSVPHTAPSSTPLTTLASCKAPPKLLYQEYQSASTPTARLRRDNKRAALAIGDGAKADCQAVPAIDGD